MDILSIAMLELYTRGGVDYIDIYRAVHSSSCTVTSIIRGVVEQPAILVAAN